MRPIQKLILRKVINTGIISTWSRKVSLPLIPRDCDLHWIQAVLKKQNGWYVLGNTASDCKICLAFSSKYKFLQLPPGEIEIETPNIRSTCTILFAFTILHAAATPLVFLAISTTQLNFNKKHLNTICLIRQSQSQIIHNQPLASFISLIQSPSL